MSKNFTKEQLENDALVTGYAKTVSYVRTHTPTIIGIVVGVLVLIGGVIGYTIYSQNQERNAQAYLGYTEDFFVRADYETALNGDGTALGVGLTAIVGSYGSTKAANMARYYAAISELEMGNPDVALSYMNGFKAPKGILGVNALNFHAVLIANAGDHKKAAAMFKRAADWDKNNSTTPSNLLSAAHSALLAGDTAMASNLAAQIIKEYETSPAAASARKIQGQLSVN
jgi:predicted negative regulator of RcsB-dependent stress response